MDMDEGSQAPIILGRPFLATTGAAIDVQASTMSFQFCGERVDFCFPSLIPSSVSATPPLPEAPAYSIPHGTVSSVTVFNRDGGPHIRSIVLSDLPLSIPTTHGGTTFHPGEVLEATPFITTPPPAPSILPSSANLRTLNKRLLEGNSGISLLSKKRCVILPPPSPLPLGAISFPLPLVFLFILFIEDNENLKNGEGVSLLLFGWNCGFWGMD